MNRHDYDKAVEWAVGELRGAVPQFQMSTAEVVAHFHWDNQDEDNMLVGLCDMTDTCVISHDVCLLIVGARLQAGMPLPRACIEWAGKMLHKARVGLNRPKKVGPAFPGISPHNGGRTYIVSNVVERLKRGLGISAIDASEVVGEALRRLDVDGWSNADRNAEKANEIWKQWRRVRLRRNKRIRESLPLAGSANWN